MFRILVVDDEHPIREWLVYAIRSNRPEFLVDSAQNGLEALEKCKASPFDLLILDIRMPHMDGLELLEVLARECPDTGAIVLSSYDDFNYVRKAFKHQAADYLLKTEIDNEKLLNAIDHFCDQKATARSLGQLTPKLLSALQDSAKSGGSFLQELSRYGDLAPQGRCFCFLLKAPAEDNSFKMYLPTLEKTVLRFCLPIGGNQFMGCVELLMQPSMLILMQTQSMYLKKLQTYNKISLLLYSDILHDARNLLDCLQTLYTFRALDFYGVHLHKPEPVSDTLELQLNEQYLEIVESLRSHRHEDILARCNTLLQFAETARYPDVETLKMLCIKLCESAYLSNYTLDLMEYHSYSRRLSPLFFRAVSFSQLRELLLRGLDELYLQNIQNASALSSRIAHAVSLVEEHYMDSISLVSVANDLHINPEYLSRTFKKQVGVNFNTYLNNVRLQHALELLKHTETRVAEISTSTGFQNPAYFSKCFKAAFGLSPQQWKASDASKP